MKYKELLMKSVMAKADPELNLKSAHNQVDVDITKYFRTEAARLSW